MIGQLRVFNIVFLVLLAQLGKRFRRIVDRHLTMREAIEIEISVIKSGQ